jgi:hypothetical protein
MRSSARRCIGPALVLFLLSPIVGELLSGSSPPIEFFNPVAFLFMAGLYGSGAVIIRELSLRWGKGWVSILLMGAAYGIIEEGLEVKSFFDPGWIDIGALGSYGRFLGVNWVWTVQLTAFHMVFSIAIPILLVTLWFSDDSGRSWVSDRTLKLLGAILALDVIVGFIWLTPYRPPFWPYVAAITAVIALFIVAYLIPRHPFPAREAVCARPRRFFLIGLGSASMLFIVAWSSPGWGVPAVLPVLLMLSLGLLSFIALLGWSGNGQAWGPKHQLALAAGALSFLIALAVIQEFWGPSNMIGMGLVGAALVAFLLFLWSRLSHEGGPMTPPEFRAQRMP